jgi:ADP-heptose:LPS heptosyltransferase
VELLRHVSGIHAVKIADTKAWRRKTGVVAEVYRTIRELRRQRYDAVFDFQGLMKSALLSRLSGGKCVVGFPKSHLREKPSSYFYTCEVEIDKGKRHQIDLNLDLVDPSRNKTKYGAEICLRVPDKVEEYLDAQFEELGIAKPVLVNPGAGWPTKRWPIERYVALAELIEEKLRIPVLFTYGPGEEGLIEEAREINPALVKAFPSSILELAAICRRSRLMVAGDTGPMHLAVAQGTPVVALIGPGYPWRTGPYNPSDKVVQHERPCPHPYQRHCEDHFCMDLPVNRVYRAVGERLGN